MRTRLPGDFFLQKETLSMARERVLLVFDLLILLQCRKFLAITDVILLLQISNEGAFDRSPVNFEESSLSIMEKEDLTAWSTLEPSVMYTGSCFLSFGSHCAFG